MSFPLVSVIIPVFNCERTVGAAVHSITGQTCQDWELLLIDDGSTDRTVDILNELAQGDSRVSVFLRTKRRRDVRAVSTRLNELIDRARGHLIARMDADDIAHPQRLAKQVEFMRDHPSVDLVASSMLIIGYENEVLGKRVGPTFHAAICRRPGIGFRMFHPTWLARAEWFRKYRFRPEARWGEDQDLLLRAYRDSTFACMPEPLLAYREGKIKVLPAIKTRATYVRRSLPVLWSYDKPAAIQGLGWHATRAAVDAMALFSPLQRPLRSLRVVPLSESDEALWGLHSGTDKAVSAVRYV